MIDVHHPLCLFGACDLRPSYGKERGKPIYCVKHKEDGMYDVVSRLCSEKGCGKQPTFGFINKKPEYCKDHKTPEMVVVLKCTKCQEKGCSKPGLFNFPSESNGIYCKKHSAIGMIDVNRRRCKEKDCGISASYGKPGHPLSHCTKHRKPCMVKRSNSNCLECTNKAVYGTMTEAKHCEEHKSDKEINLSERKCLGCGLEMILNDAGKCEYCEPISMKASLHKQDAIMAYLDRRGLNGTATDKIIESGVCGKERPDRVYETDEIVLIFECDENQHKDRLCTCEQTRMINIGQSFGGLPVYFIRWNPDSYKPKVAKTKCVGITARQELVGDFISSILEKKTSLPHAHTSCVYLFYDGWNGLQEENWNILSAYDCK
jgi:hypothetical protein